MAQKKVKCPACGKQFTERGLHLHFRQALSGWDPVWDSSQPHTKWARGKGVKVADGGYTSDFEKLKDVLNKYLSGQ